MQNWLRNAEVALILGCLLSATTAYGGKGDFCNDPSIMARSAISPNGKLAAWADYQNSFVIYVKDDEGRIRHFPDPFSEESKEEGIVNAWRGNIWSLKWSTNNVLRVTIIASHRAAIFDFLKIPKNFSKPVMQVLPSQNAPNCIYRSRGKLAACTSRYGWVSFESNQSTDSGYQVNAFVNPRKKEEFALKVGQSYRTQTGSANHPYPYKITLEKIQNGKVYVDVGIDKPNYFSEIEYGSQGQIISLDLVGLLYGLKPVAVMKDKARFQLMESQWSTHLTDLGIAWQQNGPGLYLVRHMPKQSELYLIQPTGNHGGWHLVAKAALPVKAQVMSMTFITPHILGMNVGDHDNTSQMFARVELKRRDHEGKTDYRLKVGPIKPLDAYRSILEKLAPERVSCMTPWRSLGIEAGAGPG